MMSWSKMMQRLLLATICFTLCSAEVPAMLPAMFKPIVMYTSPNSAVIKWEELRRNHEKDDYTVEYGQSWQNSKTIHVSRRSNMAMIPDLEPDTLYNIRVRVPDVTNGGATLPGPSVSFRTSPVASARIGVPQSITLVPLPLYKLLVSWDLPHRARASDVVHYSLVFAPVYSPYLRKTSLLLPGHYKSFTLTYLRPNTLYKVKIAALLKRRKGPYSAWVIAQTVGQVRLENPTLPNTKIPLSKTTSSKLHNQTEIPGTIMTTPSTSYRTEEQSSPKTQATEKKMTTGQDIEGKTLPVTVQPSEREGDETQQTSQETEGERLKTTLSLLRTTTPSPSQHTEQVTEMTPQTRLTTGGTRELTTRRVKLKTTTSPPPRKTTKHTQPAVTTTTTPPLPRKTTTTLQSTEEAKISTEQTVDSITELVTATQPTKQTTEQAGRVTRKTTQQSTTRPNQQTTKKPTSGHLQTNTVMSGTVDLILPTTDVVTDQRVTDSRLFKSSPSPTQPSIIITPSSSSVPSLVITGTLPTTSSQDTCEVLKPSMCSDIGYQTTKMTSKAKRQSQMMDLVQSMWSHLTPLCKSHGKLKQFLCAASFPYCSKDLGGPFLPCRSMCMVTKKRCNMNSEDWPAELDCSKFPDVGESAICISYGHESTPSTTTIQGTLSTPVPTTDTASESQTISTLATKSGLATSIPITKTKKPPKHCEPLYLKACEGVGYKYVQFPNFFNHSHQNDAGVKISKYWPLIEVKCSPLFQLFLCSLYTPICTSTATRNVLPCRSLCQQVASDCSYLMKLYGFAWPEGIKCQDFPDPLDGTCLSQKYLTNLRQGNEHAAPTLPSTSDKAQVTSQYKRPSTQAPLTTSQTVSVNPGSTTIRSSPYSTANPISVSLKRDMATLAPQPKTEKNMDKEYVEESTEAIAQRNEEFTSSVKPTTGSSANEETKSISISSPTSPPPGCEGLYLKMCQGVGYHFIQLPNFFNHTHQNDAGRHMYRFWPLVETNCSSKIRLFLCSLYAPMCTKTVSSVRRITGTLTNNVLPCRSLCHQVKRECRTLMKLYGLKWPQGVECKGFPMDNEETCMYGKTNDMESKGLLKVTKAKETPTIPSSPGTTKCQPLPPGHPCKNHYEMASLPNASATFEKTKKFIEDQTSKIKDKASKKCLRNLEMFLCSVRTPRCFGNGTIFGPCRSQCKTTLRRCEALLEKINVDVIDLKDCRRFPLTQCTGNKRRSKPKTKSVESL